MTEMELSVWMVTTMSSQWPASASSMELSTTSEDEVVQTGAVRGVADVHAGALAHGFEAFQDLDGAGVMHCAAGRGGRRCGTFSGGIAHDWGLKNA